MRSRSVLFFILALCAGVFTAPAAACAGGGEKAPLSIAVWLDSGILHVLAEDESDIAAVYVNQKRLDYPEGGLSISAEDYADAEGRLSVYAADKHGNVSNTAALYITDEAAVPAQKPAQTPKPFTPDGSATVMDNAAGGDGKEFFTITTAKDNVFYLIIDRQRTEKNVYFLNPVTEEDLMALADSPNAAAVLPPVPAATLTPAEEPAAPTSEPSVSPEPALKDKAGIDPRIIIGLVLIGAGIIAAYYIMVLRPGKRKGADYTSEGDENEPDSEEESEGDDLDGGFDYDDEEIPYDKPDYDDTDMDE